MASRVPAAAWLLWREHQDGRRSVGKLKFRATLAAARANGFARTGKNSKHHWLNNPTLRLSLQINMKWIRDHWRWALNGAVLLGLLIAGTKYLSGGQFWSAIGHFRWIYALPILGLTLIYLGIRGLRFGVPLHYLSGLDRKTAAICSVAGEGAALMPGGVMTYLAMLKQVGVKVGRSGAAVAWVSFLDQGLFVSLSLIAALWLPVARSGSLAVLATLTVFGVLLAVPITRLWLIVAWETVLLQLGILVSWRDGLAAMRDLMTVRVASAGLLLTLAAALSMAGALDFAVSGLGADITFVAALLAYTLSTMLGRLTPLPGGVGVTEAALVGVLHKVGGIGLEEAAAATAIFRVGTTLFGAVVGTAVYGLWWNRRAEKVAA